MNILNFFEIFVLRDILAFILPGGISLAGIYMILLAVGFDELEKTLPFLSKFDPFLQIILFSLISFLVGHVWDTRYRLKYQIPKNDQGTKKSDKYQVPKNAQRTKKFEEILIGNSTTQLKSGNDHIFNRINSSVKKLLHIDRKKTLENSTTELKPVNEHIPNQIRSSVGEFLHIDWEKTPIEDWIKSDKAHELSVLLSYWIEEEDPKIYNDEIARTNIQSHFLHVCGMAFQFFGLCILIGEVFYFSGEFFSRVYGGTLQGPFFSRSDIVQGTVWTLINPFVPLLISIMGSFWFGYALIKQGEHKRNEILVEHVFRVFYVIWQKRVREHKRDLEKARHW
jgi:hypothetical protein